MGFVFLSFSTTNIVYTCDVKAVVDDEEVDEEKKTISKQKAQVLITRLIIISTCMKLSQSFRSVAY